MVAGRWRLGALYAAAALLLAAALVLAPAAAQAQEDSARITVDVGGKPYVKCATHSPSLEESAEVQRVLEEAAARMPPIEPAGKAFNVPVFINVITTSTGQGAVSDAQIAEQMEVLNRGFAPDFTFTLKSVRRIVNDAWYNIDVDSPAFVQMKTELRKGGRSSLNVYICAPTTSSGSSLLGQAFFPSAIAADNSNLGEDGIVMDGASMPGGSAAPYNLGGTLVHETGHWLQLYHTFQFGCAPGDSIPDTAPEQNPNFGCPQGAAIPVCPGTRLPAPINNFMDYSTDACYESFSIGQFSRAVTAWRYYRAGR